MQRVTKKQKLMLEFIEAFIVEHGYSPTFREIAAGMGYGSLATVAGHIDNLVLSGHLIKTENSARSLELVRPPDQTIQTLSDLKIYLAKHWPNLDEEKKEQVRQGFKAIQLERLLPEENLDNNQEI